MSGRMIDELYFPNILRMVKIFITDSDIEVHNIIDNVQGLVGGVVTKISHQYYYAEIYGCDFRGENPIGPFMFLDRTPETYTLWKTIEIVKQLTEESK
jgi:hypothetical protein